MRLSKVASELNITWQRISEFLEEVGSPIEGAVTPNARINESQHDLLINEFQSDVSQKQKSDQVLEEKRQKRESMMAQII